VHLIGFIIRIYHDARLPERQSSKDILYAIKYKSTKQSWAETPEQTYRTWRMFM